MEEMMDNVNMNSTCSSLESPNALDIAIYTISDDSDLDKTSDVSLNRKETDVIKESDCGGAGKNSLYSLNVIDLTVTPKDNKIIKKFNHKSVASTSRKKKKVIVVLSESSDDENIPPKSDIFLKTDRRRRSSFSSEDEWFDKNPIFGKTDHRSPPRSCGKVNNSNTSEDSFENFLTKYKTPSRTNAPKPDFSNEDSFIAKTTDEENDDQSFHLSVRNTNFPIPSTKIESDDKRRFMTLPRNYKVRRKVDTTSNENVLYKEPADAKTKLSFLASLSSDVDFGKCDPEAVTYRKSFIKTRQELTDKLYKLYNKKIFSNELPHDMEITWNQRMRKTAGFCYTKRIGVNFRTARIELAPKVVDCAERLRDTLLHELCHAAAWLISGVRDGHGQIWKMWTKKALSSFPELPPVTKSHTYEIATKYIYKCSQCHYQIGRHSKSINLEKFRCPLCFSHLRLFRGNIECSSSNPVGFAAFVKENYCSVKKTNPQFKHNDVMKQLSTNFACKLNFDD